MPRGNGSRSIQDRARTGSGVDPQDGLFDKQWEDADLEAALEERERLRQHKLAVTKEYKLTDDTAKDLLGRFELAVGEVARVGRFRIKKTQPAPTHVEFDTVPQPRLNIGLIGDED
jgi:hypothetical protein